MENPYQSPETPFQQHDGNPFSTPNHRRRPGFVRHVRTVAILMIVQGGFEILMSLILFVLAVVMPLMLAQGELNGPMQQGQLPPEAFFWILPVIYGGLGLLVLLVAVLHIVAGVKNYRFRSKTLGIVAMTTGLLSLLTCYCLPTAAGIMVYGLVIYLNEEVAEVFRMGEAGYQADDILATFRRLEPDQ